MKHDIKFFENELVKLSKHNRTSLENLKDISLKAIDIEESLPRAAGLAEKEIKYVEGQLIELELKQIAESI